MTRSLSTIEADRERRARGIELGRWLAAPSPPVSRDDCEDGPRPCPCLRCEHHLGEQGDRTFSCVLDFAALPAEERTFERIAAVLGTSQETTIAVAQRALTKARDNAPREVLVALGLRGRSTGQR